MHVRKTNGEESTVEAGVYTVRVDLYEECDVTAPTNYIVTARLNGEMIAQQGVTNPYNGNFPANSIGDKGGSGSGVQVIQFNLTANQLKSTASNIAFCFYLPPLPVFMKPERWFFYSQPLHKKCFIFDGRINNHAG